ncbi:MAG: YfhO family protein [Lachnospiraceae bacterium]|nr:YfhO family protein [Lachnospiraceae bacterium]
MNLTKFKINLSERKKYFLAYTVCFSITSFIVYFWFIQAHRTLIWREDGWNEYYKALIYYSKYLRSIIKGLLVQHKLIIPNWDFAIGEGGDILTSMHACTIGDPFNVFSIFFSEDNMYLYYDFAIILRMFVAGITFSLLCFETGKSPNYAVLAGAMTYAFCSISIYSNKHPLFYNPIIYMPLLIMGIEQIIKKKRPYLFIFTVAISAISNLYFFYMLVLAVIIYVIIRAFLLYRKNIKAIVLLIVRIGVSSILGVILSAVITFPICYAFLDNSRVSVTYNINLFYPLSYYSIIPEAFISQGGDYHLYMGFSIPVLFAVFLMYYKKKQYQLTKTLFITCVIIIIFPVLGHVFNGFAYAANRWIWAFSLLCAYILILLWPSLMNLNVKESIFLFKCITLYFVICILFEYSHSEQALSSIIIGFISLIILIPLYDKGTATDYRKKQLITLSIIITSVIINNRWGSSFFSNSNAGEYLEVRQLALNANETAAVAETADIQGINEYYRFSGRNLTKNANIISGISSTEFFWSLSNPRIAEYRSSVDILENRSFDSTNFDDRAALTTLASVLYYVIPQNDTSPVPYGFTYVDNLENQSSYKVYQNEYSLPLTYTYDSYMPESEWNTLSPAGKGEAMLQTAVLSEDAASVDEKKPELSSYELPYTITCNSDDITFQHNTFLTTNNNVTATFSFDAVPNSEIYICFEGIDFKETPRYDLYYGDPKLDPMDLYNDMRWGMNDYNSQMEIKKEKIYWSNQDHNSTSLIMSTSNNESKTLHYYTNDFKYYDGRHDFAATFVSGEEGINAIDISFYLRGVYSFDSIKIICQPMDDYASRIEGLKDNSLQNMNIGTNSVTGNITLKRPGLLCFSIPHSDGWSAYVDGQKAKIYQANIMHMALDLDAGTHEIKLVYRTPFLLEGTLVSLCGIVIFIIFIIINERKLRKNKQQKLINKEK